MTANIITPQNVQQIFGSPYIPDNQVLYVRVGLPHPTYEGDIWRNDIVGSIVKIIVRDMRSYTYSLLVCGEIIGEHADKGQIKTFDYPSDTFMLNYFSKYFWIFVTVTKFKILLRRVRIKKDKKNAKTFLMWTKTAEGEFGGGSNFPVRKAIVDYVVSY